MINIYLFIYLFHISMVSSSAQVAGIGSPVAAAQVGGPKIQVLDLGVVGSSIRSNIGM